MKILNIAAFVLWVCAYPAWVQDERPAVDARHSSQDWPIYGGTSENNHYSPLKKINRENVKQLQVAWSFDTGEQGGLQTSPIEVGGVFYGISPTQRIFA